MKIYADTNKPTTNRPITITTEVTPLVSGKGRIGIDAHVNWFTQNWEFLSPVHNLVDRPAQSPDTITLTDYSVVFIANQRLVVPWKVQLRWHEHHSFFASLTLDSVFVIDSNRYFGVGSTEARIRTPGGYGYNNVATFNDLPIDP
ncbi:MAG: hypothetical protein JST22_12445 [Bacteroidetes bacterium]|nr:hypothetical protein [Bacteroidota bacterium]